MYNFYSSKDSTNRLSFAARHQNGVLEVAVARCSNKEHFVKRRGRAKAEGRLNGGKLFLTKKMEECSPKEFVETIAPFIEQIEQNPAMINQEVINL